MKTAWVNLLALIAVGVSAVLVVGANFERDHSVELLNVSYDPTRELFQDLNKQFETKYQRETGKRIAIQQSHGGSSRQAHAVADGLAADVVTLALSSDVDVLSKRGLITPGWSKRLPHESQPWSSTIVFVVRKGNPWKIHDWPDLLQRGLLVITPDPKTSGNGKLSVLAAWGSVIHRGGTEAQARDYVQRLFENVPVLDAGARGAANTFAGEKTGDAHLTWENEALREVAESGGELEMVYPPASILAEPSVAWVDANVAKRHTGEVAKAYLAFLFTGQAQEIIAAHGYRPIDPVVLNKHAATLPKMELFPVTTLAKDWNDAQQKFFGDNGIFETIGQRRAKL
jgi:sulfate/thiosulfate-binding protein